MVRTGPRSRSDTAALECYRWSEDAAAVLSRLRRVLSRQTERVAYPRKSGTNEKALRRIHCCASGPGPDAGRDRVLVAGDEERPVPDARRNVSRTAERK